MTSYATPYGTIEVAAGGYERTESGSCRRVDRYTPAPWDNGKQDPPVMEWAWCSGPHDVSPRVSTYAHQIGQRHAGSVAYSAKCPRCYLGHTHTVQIHDLYIAGGAKP